MEHLRAASSKLTFETRESFTEAPSALRAAEPQARQNYPTIGHPALGTFKGGLALICCNEDTSRLRIPPLYTSHVSSGSRSLRHTPHACCNYGRARTRHAVRGRECAYVALWEGQYCLQPYHSVESQRNAGRWRIPVSQSLADGTTQIYQSYLDKSVPFTTYRWIGTGVVFFAFTVRIFMAQGWYIGAAARPTTAPQRR